MNILIKIFVAGFFGLLWGVFLSALVKQGFIDKTTYVILLMPGSIGIGLLVGFSNLFESK